MNSFIRNPLIATLALVVAFFALAGAVQAQERAALPAYVIEEFGEPPAIPTGPLSDALEAAVVAAFFDSMVTSTWGDEQDKALCFLDQSGDPRLAWFVADLLRFARGQNLNQSLTSAASKLLGKNFSDINAWGEVTDHLIA